jgi:hypothetical protein
MNEATVLLIECHFDATFTEQNALKAELMQALGGKS